MNRLKLAACAALGFVLLTGICVAATRKSKETKAVTAEVAKVVAVLNPTDGNKVRGLVTFTKEGDKVKVVADIEGLTPGKHGFHIHEFGDCSAKDGASAGGHFNPQASQHAAHESSPRHVGDLGNIEAAADGKVHVELTDSMLKFDGLNSIIGRGVIVHAQADDLKSQPAGNAGPRQACAAIGLAKP